jgi:formate hydrogenlyase transcriptional activator
VQAVDRAESYEQCSDDPRFEQIIGCSPALEAVLDQVERVAPTDATVLIHGESGTGKELIARAIQQLSSRCGRAFVKLNCAAIPLDLLESELFGHERGAFTGAICQKIGRFELANRGTLFLDEVGDIPLALQPKLLRILQEQEFERLGSSRTHHVDVRLVAATNHDLADMVKQVAFRVDLYYRLNVFPILLPPLRERRDDIPLLVTHFVERFCRKLGKRVDRVAPETMSAFEAYDWPGNIRELQNLIERAVILADGGVLPNPLPPHGAGVRRGDPGLPPHGAGVRRGDPGWPLPGTQQVITAPPLPPTFRESERALILNALEAVGWVIGGTHGAATRLGLNRTTLINKMKKLGITRPAPGRLGDRPVGRVLNPWN